jgi:hypothetical protein
MSNKKNARRRTPEVRERGREIARWRTSAGLHVKFPGREAIRRRAIQQSGRRAREGSPEAKGQEQDCETFPGQEPMITRKQIEDLQSHAWETEDFVTYGTCAAALAVGPSCFGWYLCEQAILEGRCTTDITDTPTAT